MDESSENDFVELDAGREEGSRPLASLRPFGDDEGRALLRRYLFELQRKSGHLTPKERAKLALLIEFYVEDD